MINDKKIRIEFQGVVKNFYFFAKDFKIFKWLYNGKGHTKEFRVLKGINFKIYDGEIVGILGANGAGKSTVLKMIAGIYTQNGGKIKVDGKVTSLLELGAGFNPMMTGRENIYFKGNIMGLSKSFIDSIVDDVVDFADIGDYMEMPLMSYSSGMSARLGFALAVMVDPEILIIDEVFAVGDRDFQQKSKAKTMEFFEQGKTILFVSHSEDLIRTFCSRVIYLKDGFIQYDGNVEDGIKAYHADIAKNTKNYGMVYERNVISGGKLELYFNVGRIHEGKVFEIIEFSSNDISIAKVATELRKYHDHNFTDFDIEKISDSKMKISLDASNVCNLGFISFELKYKNSIHYSYIYSGDDMVLNDQYRLRLRHMSRKFVFDLTNNH